jgi:hypothetical protein
LVQGRTASYIQVGIQRVLGIIQEFTRGRGYQLRSECEEEERAANPSKEI